MDWLWLSLYHAFAMLWATFWALVVGFTISSVLQVLSSGKRARRARSASSLRSRFDRRFGLTIKSFFVALSSVTPIRRLQETRRSTSRTQKIGTGRSPMNFYRFKTASTGFIILATMMMAFVCAHASDLLVGNFVGGDES